MALLCEELDRFAKILNRHRFLRTYGITVTPPPEPEDGGGDRGEQEPEAGGVKTYSELSCASIAQGKDKELATWYLMRHVDQLYRDGKPRSWVWLDDFMSFVCDDNRLMSRSTLRRRIREGRGFLWDVEKIGRRKRVHYYSLERACVALGGVLLYHRPILIPLDGFGGLKRLRSLLYASWLVGKDDPISRASIENETTVSVRKQKRWHDAAGIERQENVAIVKYRSQAEAQRALAWFNRGGECRRASLDDSGLVLRVVMPNSYHVRLESAPFGKVSRWLRSRVMRAVQTTGLIDGFQRTVARFSHVIRRRYFENGKALKRCPVDSKDDVSYVETKRKWGKARVWDIAVQRVDLNHNLASCQVQA